MKTYIYLITPAVGWLAAQIIKYIITLRKDGFSIGDLTSSGGFPSSHSSFIVSLTTVVAFDQGIKSVYFAICAAFSAIILYDTIGVRRTTGDQTEALTEIRRIQRINAKTVIHNSKGHSLFEMVGGSVLGIIIGILAFLIIK